MAFSAVIPETFFDGKAIMQGNLLIPRPGVRFGAYPERLPHREPWSFYRAELLRARLLAVRTPSAKQQTHFLKMIHSERNRLQDSDHLFIIARIKRLRSLLVLEGMQTNLIVEIFALIDILLQSHMNICLHDPQFITAWLLLDRRLVEMETGEGKTLAVALAAATGALAGIPVHVVTANDYLVSRDAAALQPVFQALGLTTGSVTTETPAMIRPRMYGCDITYCTAKELAFDYLRDHLAGTDKTQIDPKRNLRGLCMVIIDEADSVLIDEARMPLILSGQVAGPEQSAIYRQALFLVKKLLPGEDYHLDEVHHAAHLTPAGKKQAQNLSEHMGDYWKNGRRREETMCLALAAQYLFLKGRHYLVEDKEVIIIDDTTGRQAQGRTWSRGLHQLIEAKENCPLTEARQTAAQTTFQRFFSRYLRLSGVSGTLMEAADLLLAIYGLPVVKAPLRFASRRQMMPSQVFTDKNRQWQYVVARVQALRTSGRPVLIGTDSVNDSETLSAALSQANVPHTILNARFDAEEAEIVAGAGQVAAVTVSTNMAGRGTDISLGSNLAELGGLHVIACQTNHSRRIDRQLYGRCGRQGNPGSVEHFYCIDGGFRPLSTSIQWAMRFAQDKPDMPTLPGWFTILAQLAQKMRERYLFEEQWFLFLNDRRIHRQLAFTSQNE
jgi:preprotein translocase subunit SecA